MRLLWVGDSRAQRLTASKELEQTGVPHPEPVLGRAQRLTASKELEPSVLGYDIKLPHVLNALRHQRNWNLVTALHPPVYLTCNY